MPEEITGTGGGAGSWNPSGTLPDAPLLGTGYDVGVQGEATYGTGVQGYSQSGVGVAGTSLPVAGTAGSGAPQPAPELAYPVGDGVTGHGLNGVHGSSLTPKGSGVLGEHASSGAGVTGSSASGAGVTGSSDSGTGIVGSSKTGKAGLFHGDVEVAAGSFTVAAGTSSFGTVDAATVKVSGTVTAGDVVLTGADFAEEFDLAGGGGLEPGTVVVLDDAGALCASALPYNRKVAGVISGAGSYRPAVVLDRREECAADRAVIALAGKVYCKVDAAYGPVEVGDLLTTSPTTGFAMKAQDPSRAFGSVLGKALAPLREGRALIPILVVLR